jgi:serine/threonine protein kinase/outer membrane protein assembly factor BamB
VTWQDEKSPSVVGEFRIERRIGAGGMGVVYLAMSPSGRRVALKIIRGDFADDADYRARFRHEIEAARQVSGAFTAPVVGADADADPPWMATQYFDAPTLSQRVRESGALGEDAVWQLGRGLVEALRDIHRAGLVHRDLKPSNVLLTEDGPRVIDFGIARVLNAEPLTRSGKILGTVSFMAPEQLNTPREVGPAADVFALGGVLAYAATGQGPFDADTGAPPIAVAMKIVQDDPDVTDVPAGLRSVIERCLCKDPNGRPSPAELLALLQAKGMGAIALEKPRQTTEAEGVATSPGRPPRTRAYVLSAVAVIAVAVPVFIQAIDVGGDPGGAKGPASPSTNASSTRTTPAVEPVAAMRPKGWALWEKKPTTTEEFRGGVDLPACAANGDVLVCTETGVIAEGINSASGQVVWSKRHSNESSRPSKIVGFEGETVLVHDLDREELVGFDVKTGDRLWSAQTSAQTFVVQKSGVTTVHPHVDGTRIDRRHARTGKLVASRTFPAGEWHDVFNGGDGGLYLLEYGMGEGFIASVAVLDTATLETKKVLATFDEDPGTPVAADGKTVSLVLDGKSITRINKSDGSVKRLPLQDALRGTARLQGSRLYVSRTDGMLASYDLRTGERNWTVATQGESPTRPVLADGRLYSLAGDGRITCVDPAAGKILWQSAPRRDPNTSFTVSHDTRPEPAVLKGVVYAGSTTGSIFAVAPPAA